MRQDKTTALYYRMALKVIEPHLDNQMQKLLCYAAQNDLDGYALYADAGISGITLDRPAFKEMRMALQERHIDEIVVTDLSRISRHMIQAIEFLRCAGEHGVAVILLDGGSETLDLVAKIAHVSMKGGEWK